MTMSFGKMNTFIEILSVSPEKDGEGFSVMKETVIARVRAYREQRHGNESWKNRAAFSTATALFRFRRIPDIEITNRHIILCSDGRYEIRSCEDIRGRGMYIEVLCEKVETGG